jgi:hypothetical protein
MAAILELSADILTAKEFNKNIPMRVVRYRDIVKPPVV